MRSDLEQADLAAPVRGVAATLGWRGGVEVQSWAVAALYAALAIYLSLRMNLWLDELLTLSTTAHGPVEGVRRALSFELQPPLYFLLVSLWRSLWPNELGARFISVACGTAAVLLVPGLSRRLLPGERPVWLTAALAFQPMVIWAATELRTYALVLLLSIALLRIWFVAYWDEPRTRWARPGFIALAVCGLYTQYYLGFLLASLGAGLFARGRSPIRDYLLDMVAVAALCIPLWFILAGQVAQHSDPYKLEGVKAFFAFAKQRTVQDLFPLGPGLQHLRVSTRLFDLLKIAALGLLVLLAVPLRRRWRGLERTQIGLLIACVTYALFMPTAAALAGFANVLGRHTIALIPLLLTAVVSVLATARASGGRLAAAVFAASGLFTATAIYAVPLVKDCDVPGLARFLEQHEGPSEAVAVVPDYFALELRHYFRGRSPVVPLPAEPSVDHFQRWEESGLSDERAVAIPLSRLGPHRGLWVFVGRGLYDFERSEPVLEGYLHQHYREDARVSFRETFGDEDSYPASPVFGTLRHFVPKAAVPGSP